MNKLITVDSGMLTMLKVAKKAAMSTAAILIEGETGTGKELIARYIHEHSPRASQPFVTINCAAIPHTMIEAVLFGYEKGAFTNAFQRYIGKFEQANGGTLFLDEVAEMSADVQVKLLRALQECEVERIGGAVVQKIDVRVISATNKDLIKLVAEGVFRNDLYYRLNVVKLLSSPLRNRIEDILPITEYYMNLYAQEIQKPVPQLDHHAKAVLKSYGWPGNVRELQNKIHRAIILDEDNLIDINDLDLAEQKDKVGVCALRDKEAEVIVNVLKETNGCRNDAAKKLMISPRTLRYKLLKLRQNGIEIP